MVIGKTLPSISKTEIFNIVSETQILQMVFPEIKTLPCLICSPLRVDRKPSFSLYLDSNNHVRFKDFAIAEDKGGILDLLCKYWKCTFNQCIGRICSMIQGKTEETVSIKPKYIKTLTRKEQESHSEIQVKTRPWRDYDYEYWRSYGIEPKWLSYAEIYPISYKIVVKRYADSSEKSTYIFPADRYAYAFVERKESRLQLKIYQPFNTKGYKWCSKMDGSVIGLWTKIPETGDKVVICSSLKDALCVSCQLKIPAICLQGEGYGISDTAIAELKRRYKKVFVSFDTDASGKKDAEILAEKTGFINVVPDFGEYKDFSDYYKSLKDKQQFQKLKELFN